MNKKKYSLEQSPFYNKEWSMGTSLKELKASDGEEVVLARKRYFKKDEYVKFIIEDKFDIISYHNLSKTATTVLQYIIYYCMEYNNPVFKFKVNDFSAILNIGESTVFKGLKDLIDAKYIAKTRSKEIYWINHNKFYKGNFMINKHLIKK